MAEEKKEETATEKYNREKQEKQAELLKRQNAAKEAIESRKELYNETKDFMVESSKQINQTYKDAIDSYVPEEGGPSKREYIKAAKEARDELLAQNEQLVKKEKEELAAFKKEQNDSVKAVKKEISDMFWAKTATDIKEYRKKYDEYVAAGGKRLYLGDMNSVSYLRDNVDLKWNKNLSAGEQWKDFFESIGDNMWKPFSDMGANIRDQIIGSIIPKLSFGGGNVLDAASDLKKSFEGGSVSSKLKTGKFDSLSEEETTKREIKRWETKDLKELKFAKMVPSKGPGYSAETKDVLKSKDLFESIAPIVGTLFDNFSYVPLEDESDKKIANFESTNKNLRDLINSQIEKDLDDTLAFKRLMESDPLLSTHQFNLKIMTKKDFVNNASNPETANYKKTKLISYRVKGFTIPEIKRPQVSKPYGTNSLSLMVNRIPKMEYKANLEIICDKELKVLTNLLDITGSAIREYYSELPEESLYVDNDSTKYTKNECEAIYNLSSIPTGKVFENTGEYFKDSVVFLEVLRGNVLAREAGLYIEDRDENPVDTPVFIFQNFKILSLDYDMAFSASTTSPKNLILKVEVGWTKMSIRRDSQMKNLLWDLEKESEAFEKGNWIF